MATDVEHTGDPSLVLARAAGHLAGDPVRHNLILTLLHARVQSGEPGRYWIASVDGRVGGVLLQSPLSFPATLTPMDAETVEALAAAVARQGVGLPGVSGEPATAARFAGRWTELHRVGARPTRGLRISEVEQVKAPVGIEGELRRAQGTERPRLVAWLKRFHEDVGESGSGDPEAVIADRVAAGQLFVWDHGGPASMAAITAPVAGVARIPVVYTPPERRGQGYAAACVAQLSSDTLASGARCILYTDLANPTPNAIYRSIGYIAVAEVVKYRFG